MQNVDEVMAKNTGLIYKQLKRFYLLNDPDAESAAYWALYKAITTFNDSKHTLLSTYATCCIYNALGDYVRALKRRQAQAPVSYNTIAFEEVEYEEMLSDHVTTEDRYLQSELTRRTKEAIVEIQSKMTGSKQKAVVDLFVENDYDITQPEIASRIGVTQSYVSQVLSEFKYKLKKKMEDYYRA